jgi:hypothetical protein
MKHIKRIVVVVALALAVGGFAVAQVQHGGAFGHSAGHHGDPASAVKHIAEVFPKFAAFDTNKDGKIDTTEKEALAKAIVDGTLQLPAHTPPHGVKPTAEMMLNHIAEMYAHVAPFDANHDGELDASEQAALKSAIESGEFAPHGQHAREDDDAHQ